ncbi:MAG: imidazole glycerol phosphate synthase subunit HisH [Verrucomicrobia subdivision 3 bacterium]|nr:imidazole glycerol phosphate synthase subunit HisH [Limisphaerales bacterium]
MIALLDYGAGNVRSVQKALTAAGAEVALVANPEDVARADAMVLPGVGAFDDCVNAMQRQELFAAAKDFIGTGKPFLGICVGYQALFEKSEEFNSCATGLGIFGGSVVRFAENEIKVPQIGWNEVEFEKPECPILKGIESGSHFYFVHSYFPKPTDESIVATRTNYGKPFASAVWRDNVFATQFHPEKSQKVGLKLLENFVQLADS